MKKWLSAMRLRTLPLAASCVLAGAAYGWNESPNSAPIFTLALLTTFLLQILSNLANDYGDFASGVDNDQRVGPMRAMQSGAISKKEMLNALILCSALTLISGMTLLYTAFYGAGLFGQAILFLMVGILAIVAAIKYTVGKNPYGYSGFGDLAVFLFFGMIGVLGNYYLLTKSIDVKVMFPAISVGLYSAAVLNLNNLRDHINDKSGGKNTLVVRIGYENGKRYHVLIVLVASISAAAGILQYGSGWSTALPLLPVLLQLILSIKVLRTVNPAALDGELKKVAILTFLYGILLFMTSVFC